MMGELRHSNPSLDERIRDLDVVQRALARAVRDALRRHKQGGNPVVVWRDGRIVWIAPDDIQVTAGED